MESLLEVNGFHQLFQGFQGFASKESWFSMGFISFFNVFKGLPPKNHGGLGLGAGLERLNHQKSLTNHIFLFFFYVFPFF